MANIIDTLTNKAGDLLGLVNGGPQQIAAIKNSPGTQSAIVAKLEDLGTRIGSAYGSNFIDAIAKGADKGASSSRAQAAGLAFDPYQIGTVAAVVLGALGLLWLASRRSA